MEAPTATATAPDEATSGGIDRSGRDDRSRGDDRPGGVDRPSGVDRSRGDDRPRGDDRTGGDDDAAGSGARRRLDPGPADAADLERRFGGLRRLYGDAAYERIRAASIVVVGVGGVGSWVAEGLARSGVGRLTLIDLDQVSESNINRQVQAVGATVGQAKVVALAERVRDIHPGCVLHAVEEFVDAANWPALLPEGPVDVVVDACDQVRAKAVMAAWALAGGRGHVIVGAAGGKRRPEAVAVEDLAKVTHDPLLASLRQRLRQSGAAPRGGGTIGLRCVFSRESVAMPDAGSCAVDGSLNCHGYGSSVAVTATFGMVAVALALDALAHPTPGQPTWNSGL